MFSSICRQAWYFFIFVCSISLFSALGSEKPFDPFFWMEEVEGERALDWVKSQNARTVSALESTPVFEEIHKDLKALYFATDRVPFSSFSKGYFWNFWQDATHKHGIIRRTSYEEYLKVDPVWETILDLDELSKVEGKNWVYKGGSHLDRNSSRRLLQLSIGGKDAVVVREFDYETRQFIADGFNVPEAKSRITPLGENRILIGTDFGEGSLTDSGYPRILKLLNRGESLSQAKTVFEVKATDMAAGASKIRDGEKEYVLFYRKIDFFNSEVFLEQEDHSLRKLPIPTTAEVLGLKGKHLYIQLKEKLSLNGREIPLNTILRYGFIEENLDKAEIIFTADPRQAIESVDVVDSGRMFITVLDNIRNKVLDLTEDGKGAWQTKALPFPTTGVISFGYKDKEDLTDFSVMTYTDHLTPSSQYRVHDEDGSFRLELLKGAPARFDSSPYEVVQNMATSRDGTKVPYFVLKRKDLVQNGSHPTILYGYGGFEISLTPSYSGGIGKAWLERGGVYVIANIRGGGEFGPEWHQAALKHDRQRAYDDFISVAEDLIARKYTSPAHLGIKGGSNGGLLIGAVMVQRPELFGAAHIAVPLLDMVRYSKLLAGASWIGEYGDPENEQDCAALLRISPYHNVKPGVQYPSPLFTTSTKDDRVHPGHARKMAIRMSEQGHPFYYYENINGGHAGSANLEESARMEALGYSYMWMRLK